MDFSEPNPYRRNLLIMSIGYIILALTDAKVVPDQSGAFSIGLMKLQVEKPELLPIISIVLLIWFAFRFRANDRVGYSGWLADIQRSLYYSFLAQEYAKSLALSQGFDWEEEAVLRYKGGLTTVLFSILFARPGLNRVTSIEPWKCSRINHVNDPLPRISKLHRLAIALDVIGILLSRQNSFADFILPWCLFLVALLIAVLKLAI
ncbi:hypothetical protein [Gilvimarinus xylanilyticus]|uniref:Uncharacterized protein n=1 Tax=Gilvimarinus xylanilyticus TaxID=2944139 RepID=A0A9X2HW57_9GAMM|nr:hypothetical protein [Gilvimarinus xylanilyticus]MCP8898119.1 hypothetical protein [Gilvimarinus xylanilyticus]